MDIKITTYGTQAAEQTKRKNERNSSSSFPYLHLGWTGDCR
jgi:hypothetical protein